jgi:hypothetical protein
MKWGSGTRAEYWASDRGAAMINFGTYRGLYLVGDKAKNHIKTVRVVNPEGNSVPFTLVEYVARRIEPNFRTLPWREDIKINPAQPI